MSDSVVSQPHCGLMAEAQHEREIVDSPEAQALLADVFKAVDAYSEFLVRHDLIWEDAPGDWPRVKAQALVITVDYFKFDGIVVDLKDGAIDRVYGNGTNPDALGRGPPDILHKHRNDD